MENKEINSCYCSFDLLDMSGYFFHIIGMPSSFLFQVLAIALSTSPRVIWIDPFILCLDNLYNSKWCLGGGEAGRVVEFGCDLEFSCDLRSRM